ncbi:hypothetical protein CERSUDRAFT_141028 [Gelatoporia subvermispora B]|uniref:Uncharacterized protein n=1 Tax=Ceriporiopsis subvermispora (strain B) TaxID=914234 RepID=M2QBY7_CERS8|nr:hypothetical protein CERSUDRAFT_141028 [Gelatoporia subvermispora B]
MDQREDIPRISVDSLQDWHRIRENYTAAALAALDAELEATGSSAERDLILQHLHRFIDRTFEMTRPNVRVNGKNFEELQQNEEEEPFDEGFDRHIWALSEQSLKWDKEIAEKRRIKPQEAEKLMKELFADRQALDEVLASDLAALEDDIDMAEEDLPESIYESLEQTAQKTYAITEELQQSIPAQAERAERVKVVASEIKSLKP